MVGFHRNDSLKCSAVHRLFQRVNSSTQSQLHPAMRGMDNHNACNKGNKSTSSSTECTEKGLCTENGVIRWDHTSSLEARLVTNVWMHGSQFQISSIFVPYLQKFLSMPMKQWLDEASAAMKPLQEMFHSGDITGNDDAKEVYANDPNSKLSAWTFPTEIASI